MPTVRHPRALAAVAGHPPDRVTVNGTNYAVADDGTVSLPDDAAVNVLARAYDLEASALDVDAPEESEGNDTADADVGGDVANIRATIDDGECPWCLEYTGENVGQHASKAHSEEWRAFKEASE